VIDKLDLRIPRSASFRPEVQKLVREIDYGRNTLRVRSTPYYAGVSDLRPELGIEAVLHAYCKHGDSHDHKLEIIDTGKKSYSDLAAVVGAVFEGNPESYGLMRIDLCADMHGVPVLWFLPRARIKFKRYGSEMGELKYGKLGQGTVETIMAGKRPNVFRFYDKAAESKMQFKKLLRKQSPDSEPLDFEKEFGFAPDSILTRVERQFGGGRIPEEIDTFSKLHRLPDYNPFDTLEIVTGSPHRPAVEQCSGLSEYLNGVGIAAVINEMGLQQGRSWLNKHSGGNAARLLDRYGRFLAPPENEMTLDRIVETYRNSVLKQLSA
jgi:hypothetical protein